MAKRKVHRRRTHHRAHTTHHRRRRVGAMSLSARSPLVKFGSVAAGYLFADKINAAIDKVSGTMDSKIVAGAEIGLGGLLVMGKLARGNTLLTAVGGIIAGAGLKRGMKAFGVVSGFRAVPVISNVAGFQSVPVISGYTPNRSLNGYRTAQVPINGVHSKVMGGVGKGTGMSNGSELMG